MTDKNLDNLISYFEESNFYIASEDDCSITWVRHNFPCKKLSTICYFKFNDNNIWFKTTLSKYAVFDVDPFKIPGVLTSCHIDDLVVYKNEIHGEYVVSDNREMPFWKIKEEE